jgi:hypothetical protein
MREILGVFYILALQTVVLGLTGIGSLFSSAASVLHVHFLRVAHRHDEKYAPKDPRAPKVIFQSSGADSSAN